MNKNIHREITQLSPSDSFLVYYRIKDDFDFPIHFHPEYELNFIHKGSGVRRVIGDHIGEINDYELVLVGPNLPHCWELHNCKEKEIHEITIHIHNDLLDEKLLSRRVFKSVRDMLNRSIHGISFSEKTIKEIMPRLLELPKISGIDYFLEFISILHDLSISRNQKLLSTSFSNYNDFENSEKIKKVYEYIQNNFNRKISLDEISELVNMTPVSFNRFIKKRTGKTFVSYINNTRVSYASRLLLETDLSVGEIAYKCGFNNLANFNRMFKKIKNNTPSEFRSEFNGIQKVL
ncbi:helix-turn-helix domain-containing protein [Tenacibaculum jejuense]|uniref:Probable transcriptional regulator, AraC family n=1 Tax=Tenacibaculum jejuense TaxID=584609 RepID=A0A238UBH4_9FLAO|nr:AraC family transcriptional regulator [Tenacibaculum jejuense]SNR16519.1 Probable transcriptional regulator, AraC family [Tenacibaculum jejuense]